MLAEQRHIKILNLLEENGFVKTKQLASLLEISFETARKDLEQLHNEGCITRVHGGAMPLKTKVSAKEEQVYLAYEARSTLNKNEKGVIAQFAAQMVTEGQSVALDAGTSNYALAKELKDQFNSLIIITNSLKIAGEFADKHNFTVIVTGGIMMGDEHSLVSEFALLILKKVNIDVMFLSASGVNTANGVTDQRVNETLVQNAMRSVSKKVILLADNSKIGKSSLVQVCPLSEIDTIVTDEHADCDSVMSLRNAGCNVVIAK